MIGRQVQTGERDTVQAPYVNSGMLETRGMDISVNWTGDIGEGSGGSFYINSIVTLLDEFKIQDAAGEPILDVRDTLSTSFYGAQYTFKLNNTFGYNFPNGRASVGLNWRYLPDIRSDTAARNPATTQLGAEDYSVFGLNARFIDQRSGSSSAAASTTCSTRSRWSSKRGRASTAIPTSRAASTTTSSGVAPTSA